MLNSCLSDLCLYKAAAITNTAAKRLPNNCQKFGAYQFLSRFVICAHFSYLARNEIFSNLHFKNLHADSFCIYQNCLNGICLEFQSINLGIFCPVLQYNRHHLAAALKLFGSQKLRKQFHYKSPAIGKLVATYSSSNVHKKRNSNYFSESSRIARNSAEFTYCKI